MTNSFIDLKKSESLEKFKQLKLEFPRDSPIEKHYTKLDLDLDELENASPAIKTTLLNGKALILSLEDALEKHEDLLKKSLGRIAVLENKLDALHYSNLESGVVIITPPGQDATIEVAVNSSGNKKHVGHHVLVISQENSQTEVIEKINSDTTNSVHTHFTECFALENAKINYYTLQDLSMESMEYSERKASAGKNTEVNWVNGNLGGNTTINKNQTIIVGEGASGKNQGFFYAEGKQHKDITANTTHEVPNSTHKTLTKGVVTGNSNCVYRGNIRIKQKATNTNSELDSKILVLSETAKANSIPSLEIDNNDVWSKHATSISQIDPEQMFYLTSKGVSKEQAEHLIIEGYFQPVLNQIIHPNARKEFADKVIEKINRARN